MRVGSRTLDRKMIRELWRLRAQLLSIGLVVATGVTTVVTLRGTYEALFRARAAYYQDYRLADVWSSLERAPESLRERIQEVPGVATVATRVSTYATLDLPWLDAPGMGLFLSVPDRGRPDLDDIHVRQGRYLAPGRAGEVVASEAFFRANGLSLGDTVRAVLNGRRVDLRIVGVAISPEHSYSVPPGSLYPEDERYGVFWMVRSALGAALDSEDAFNEVAASLAPGGNEAAVIQALNRILEPYGGLGAYGRSRQLSYKILNDELAQNRIMGTVVPAIFLGVAAFLLNLVLGRLIATQRTEIGTLKAFGYTDREVGWHYLSYALVAVGIGTALGAAGGVWAGDAMVELYQEYFTFPTLDYVLSGPLVLIGSMVSLVAAVGGAWISVGRATGLTPAEAMRPEPPPRFRPGWIERLGLGRMLPTGGRLVLRNMERRPVRSLLSSLGVAFSVAILVVGAFMFDGISRAMELQFAVSQREDLAVSFNRTLGSDAVHELRRMEGVRRAEPFHAVPVRLVAGHRSRELALTGLAPDAQLRAIVDADARIHPLPLEGVVMSAFLAQELHVGPGSRVTVEVLTGRRATGELVVTRLVDDFLGTGAHVTLDVLERLTGERSLVSGAYLQTDPARTEGLHAEIKKTPAVASVTSPRTMLASFRQRIEDSLYISIGLMLGFAGIISVAVIYNGTRIALSERGRELASLRVLGFTRREVASLLLGEQAVVTVLAIPVGCAIGLGLAAAVLAAMASETYRIPLVVTSRTYLIATTATVVAAAASGWLVRRRLDRMDLIAVLKTRE
jgi:putative ABC transport system permease protein